MLLFAGRSRRLLRLLAGICSQLSNIMIDSAFPTLGPFADPFDFVFQPKFPEYRSNGHVIATDFRSNRVNRLRCFGHSRNNIQRRLFAGLFGRTAIATLRAGFHSPLLVSHDTNSHPTQSRT